MISAFQDYRFNKINLNEVPSLSVSVSLLTDFEEAKSALDWDIGKHGIQIQFNGNDNNVYSGTFLPEVAKEQNWDHKTTLAYLVRKAGFQGNLEEILDKIKTTRYQSKKVCISYEDYVSMRKDSPLLKL